MKLKKKYVRRECQPREQTKKNNNTASGKSSNCPACVKSSKSSTITT